MIPGDLKFCFIHLLSLAHDEPVHQRLQCVHWKSGNCCKRSPPPAWWYIRFTWGSAQRCFCLNNSFQIRNVLRSRLHYTFWMYRCSRKSLTPVWEKSLNSNVAVVHTRRSFAESSEILWRSSSENKDAHEFPDQINQSPFPQKSIRKKNGKRASNRKVNSKERPGVLAYKLSCQVSGSYVSPSISL